MNNPENENKSCPGCDNGMFKNILKFVMFALIAYLLFTLVNKMIGSVGTSGAKSVEQIAQLGGGAADTLAGRTSINMALLNE